MQNRQPMQRCMSCIVIPFGSLNVALVGHTRTHGGFSQWLHSTRKGISLRCSSMNLFGWNGNAFSYAVFHIHLISFFVSTLPSGFRKSGTLCVRWHASMVFLKSSSVLNLLMSTTMAHLFAVRISLFGSTCEGSKPLTQIGCVAFATEAPNPSMEEMPAIFRNCLLSMLMIYSPPFPSAEYDSPSRKALPPCNYDTHHRTSSYWSGIACSRFEGSY